MSDDDKLRSHSDPWGHAMTFTYDAHGQSPPHQSAVTVSITLSAADWEAIARP
jgi:hypothetical protein